VLVLVLASFTYVTAQINATGTIAARALGIPFEAGVWVGLVSILLCSMLGGMRAVTWTQVAQYIVLIIAYLIPVFWISNKIGAGVFPHLMLGDEVARITELESQFGLTKNSAADVKAAGVPGGLKSIAVAHAGVGAGGMAVWKYISLAICMMVGTASLPHILMRYFTTPSVKSARKSVAWSLFFIFLLYSSAPMLATLSKISLMDPNLPTGIIGKSIADVLQMTIDEACELFEAIPKIYRKLKTLQDVGLGYITLGQSSTTLSGGEAQRIKLATELSKRDTGNTLYILDEPTTGLHFEDIRVLLEVLNHLTDKGNTVLIIEHNLDVIKQVDYIIDIGPEGGKGGGKIIAEGTPEDILNIKKSHTARFLKKEFEAYENLQQKRL